MPSRLDHSGSLDIFAVHSGVGGRTEESRLGPGTLKDTGLMQWLEAIGIDATWRDIHPFAGEVPVAKPAIAPVADVCARLRDAVRDSVADRKSFLALGGDHSNAIGTWSGAHSGLDGDSRLGLLWIDAHMDSHLPHTSPSGNVHGMPVAHLLGLGAEELSGLATRGSALRPTDIAIVGVRSFEPEEQALLDRLGVRVYFMEEIAARGIRPVVREALDRITTHTQAFGISIDLDGLDPEDAPGTGSAVENGIRVGELSGELSGIGRSAETFLGLEIAEFNPSLDQGGKTVETVRLLVETVFGKT